MLGLEQAEISQGKEKSHKMGPQPITKISKMLFEAVCGSWRALQTVITSYSNLSETADG